MTVFEAAPESTKKNTGAGLLTRGFLRHSLVYLTSTYSSRALCALRSFLNAKWLGPEIYGLWGSISFLLSFCFHLHLGAMEIMAKEIPEHLKKGEKEKAKQVAQVTFSFYAVMVLTACLGVGLYTALLPPETPRMIRSAWAMASLALVLEVLYFFNQVLARAEQRFEDLAKGIFIPNLISLVLTFFLVSRHGLYGLFVVAVSTPAIGLIFLFRRSSLEWKFSGSFSKLKSMIHAGWPILAMTMVFEALWWIDRLLVIHFAGHAGFGYYAVGLLVSQVCFLFPQILASVMEPKLYADFAHSKNKHKIQEHLWLPLLILSWVMPIGLALIDLVVPQMIHWLLPAYAPGIPPLRILAWSSLLMGFAVCTKAFIVAIGKQRQVMLVYGAAIAVNTAISLSLALQGFGIPGIACGTSAAYAVCGIGLLVFSFSHLDFSSEIILRRILQLLLPVLTLMAFWFPAKSFCARIFAENQPSLFTNLTLMAFLAIYSGIAFLKLKPLFHPEKDFFEEKSVIPAGAV